MVPLSYYISLIKCVNLWRQKHLLFQRMFFKHASPDCRNINWQQFSYRVYIITTQRASLTTFTFIFVFLKFFYFYRPKCSMYGIFTNICPKNHPNVGKYSSTMEHMGYWTTHFWTESKPQFTIAWVSMSRLKEFQGYRLWEVIILNIVVQLYMSPSQSRMSNRGCWIQHSDRVFISGVILGGSLLSFRKAFHLSWLWPVQKLPIYRLMM